MPSPSPPGSATTISGRRWRRWRRPRRATRSGRRGRASSPAPPTRGSWPASGRWWARGWSAGSRGAAPRWPAGGGGRACWQLDTTGWVDLPDSCFTYSDAGRALLATRAVTTSMVPALYCPPPGARVFSREKVARLERRGRRLSLYHSMFDEAHGFEIRYEIDLDSGTIVHAESETPRSPHMGSW